MERWYSKGMEHWYRQVDENRLALHLVSTHQVASTYIDELINLYKNLLNLHFNRGHLFEILSPAQIEEIIIEANHNLQNDIEVLPHPMYKTEVDHSEENVHVYGYFYITEKTEFLLVKATPTPQKIEKDRYWTFNIPNEILGIDYNSQRYFTEPTKEFSRNIQIHDHLYIVSPAQVKSIENHPNCIIDELYQRTEYSNCPLTERKLNAMTWIQLYTRNTWLMVSPTDKTRIAIICNGIREDVKLNQTGIVTLSQNCLIKTKTAVITPRRTESVPIQMTYMRPIAANLTWSEQHSNRNPQVDLGQDVIQEPDNLLDLKQDQEELLDQLQNTHWQTVTTHSIMSSTITTAVIILTLIITAMGVKYIWRGIKSRRNRTENKRQDRTDDTKPSAHSGKSQQPDEYELQPLKSMV
ncbi:hypothetical protein ABEB36_014466 [Hypothenemus hampei]|uniref:Uncharacterized protein n=1 Tax=Hypothenemus hampei TaxID=57062 RepID=A0ABD1E6I1_HYPHA